KEAFAKAAHITKVTIESQRILGNPMEPKAALASYDAAKDVFDLYLPTQGMSMMSAGVSAVTQVPPEKIRIHTLDVGGGFGIRSDAYVEYCALMLAAKKVGRPLKWVASRSETSMSDYHGRAATLHGELALDRDGKFLAIDIRWLCNMGAYLSHAGPLINTLPPALHAANLYRIPAIHGLHRLALTNTPPTRPYRGAGGPNVAFLSSRVPGRPRVRFRAARRVEDAPREPGTDRVELRRRNVIPKEAFPYKTAIPMSTYDSGAPAEQIDKVVEHTQC